MAKKKQKSKPLTFFFFNGDLHRKVHINRGADVITAWNYPEAQLKKYVYSQVKREGQKAFTTTEAGEFINRKKRAIKYAMARGDVPMPQQTYSLDGERRPLTYYWREEDIMALHEFFTTVHRGRPRKDGRITPSNLPTATELRALIRQGTVFYTKIGDEFVPTWQAEKF